MKGSVDSASQQPRPTIVVLGQDCDVAGLTLTARELWGDFQPNTLNLGRSAGQASGLDIVAQRRILSLPKGLRDLADTLYECDAIESLIPSAVRQLLIEGSTEVYLLRQDHDRVLRLLQGDAPGPQVTAALPHQDVENTVIGPAFGVLRDASLLIRPTALGLLNSWSTWAVARAGLWVEDPMATVTSWWDREVGGQSLRLLTYPSGRATHLWRIAAEVPHGPSNLGVSRLGPAARRGLRATHRSRDLGSAPPFTPFDLKDWLLRRVVSVGGGTVPLLIESLWGQRPDLQEAFPAPGSVDYDRLLEWSVTQGVIEEGLPADWLVPLLAEPARVRARRRFHKSAEVSTVHVIRVAGMAKGVAVAGCYLEAQLRAMGYRTMSTEVDLEDPRTDATGAELVVFAINGDYLERVFRRTLMDRSARAAAYWWWETDELPAGYRRSASLVDELWAPTPFVRDIISRSLGARRVRLVPPPLPPASFLDVVDGPRMRRHLGLGEQTFVFLAQADGHSSLWRKNPLGAAQAFTEAFPTPEPDRVMLVLKTRHINSWDDEATRIRVLASSRRDILLIEDEWTHADMLDLIGATDVLVSLHRSEGFGLAIGEAMALNKTVIATRYGGNLVLDQDDRFLVPAIITRLEDPSGAYPGESIWAEPDLSAATEKLRSCAAGYLYAPTAAVERADRRRDGAEVWRSVVEA